MRSFLLACLAIVAIGVAAHLASDRLGPTASDVTTGPAVRLD